MKRPDWAPPSIDISRPHVARMSDYYLGGDHNFAVDRAAADKILAAFPQARQISRSMRTFQQRAVRMLLDQGVRQFLDLGSGIPTSGHVHEIVAAQAPEAKVLYVDTDPVVLAHGRQIIAGLPRVRMLAADLCRPKELLTSPELTSFLDLDQPVALLMLAVLQYIPADHDLTMMAEYRHALAPGSYLALSALCDEVSTAGQREAARLAYREANQSLVVRGRSEVASLFTGFALAEPGLVWVPQWRPETVEDHQHAALGPDMMMMGGVGRLG